MNSQNLRLALTGVTLSSCLVLYACSGDSGGAGDAGGGDDSTASSGSSGGSSSGGASSSGVGASSGGSSSSGGGSSSSGMAGSASSSGIVYTCLGCIDTSGRCNDGGADNRCGRGSSTGTPTCVDCTAFHQVCGASGDCVNGSSASSSSSGGADAGGGG